MTASIGENVSEVLESSAPHVEEKRSAGELYILMFSVAVVASNSLILSPILSDVAASLETTRVAISRSVAIYGAGTMLSALFLAPQIDRLGARRALRFGLLALAIALLCSAGATDPLMLMGAQAVAGLSAGIILPASYALATVYAGPKRLSRSLSKVLFGWSLAFACGIPGLAIISDFLAWRFAYLIMFAVVLIIVIEIHRIPDTGEKIANDTGRASIFSALTHRNVLLLLAVCLCFTTAFYGVFAFLADQVRHALNISASAAGAIILAFGVGFAAGTPATWLVDKIGASRLLPVVLLMNAAVYGLMGVPGHDYTATLAVVSLWGGITNVALNVIVLLLSQTSPTEKGRILGLNSATTYFGATFGVTMAGFFYESFGFHTVLLWAVLLQICGAMLLWAVKLSRPRNFISYEHRQRRPAAG